LCRLTTPDREATVDQANQEVEALVFDAYGTLFDVDSVTGACEKVFPGRERSSAGCGEPSSSSTPGYAA
jgi:hypothetical protein